MKITARLYLITLFLSFLITGCLFNPPSQQSVERTKSPKNIIIALGDGLGFGQIEYFNSMYPGSSSFNYFPIHGSISTHSLNHSITDSAAACTALFCGHKTKNGYLGLDQNQNPIENIADHLKKKYNKKIAVISNTHLTHATPASFFVHSKNRFNYTDIGHQISSSLFDILMGGGGHGLSLDSFIDPTVFKTNTLNEFHENEHLPFVALFGQSHFPYAIQNNTDYPTLCTMVKKSLSLLNDDPDGFLLFFEAGRIDHACHENNLEKLYAEMCQFNDAIDYVLNWSSNRDDTLFIVISDHETGGLKSMMDNNQVSFVWSHKKHSNLDIPILSTGVGSKSFSGSFENTDFFHKILSLYPD